MTYQDQTQALAEDTSAQVLAALAAYVAGEMTLSTFVGVVAAFIAAANSGAAALGDLALAAAVTRDTGTPNAPLGITRPATEPARLAQAAQTIAADLDRDRATDPDAALDTASMRFLRLAEAEIHRAVADAYAEAITRSEPVTGYVRGLEPDACELCTWWWREGRVWDDDHPFPRHTGCDCSQLITTIERKSA